MGGVYCFPQNLKRLREARGLSQRQLARKIFVSQAALSAWERGQKTPQIDRLCDIAAALGCKPSKLIDPWEDSDGIYR